MANRIHPSAVIGEDVALGDDNEIGPQVVIEDGVRIGSGNRIWARAFVGRGTTLGDGNQIHPGAVVGHVPQDLAWGEWPSFTRIGNRNHFREYVTIHRGTKENSETVIGDDNFFMAYAHVAHDCRVGNKVTLVNCGSLTGYCQVDDGAILSGFVGLHQFTRVGRLSLISAVSAANRDVPPFLIAGGRPAVAIGVNLVGMRRAGFAPAARNDVKKAFRILYRSGLPVTEAVERIEAELSGEAIDAMVAFIRESKRGVIAYGEASMAHRRQQKPGEPPEPDDAAAAAASDA